MNWKAIGCVILVGLVVGFVAVIANGYLAAVVVPEGYFNWFSENLNATVGWVLLAGIQQFLAQGVLFFVAAYLLVKYVQQNWIVTTVAFYVSIWFYYIVGSVLVYGGTIVVPTHLFSIVGFVDLFVPIIMLFVGAKMGITKRSS